ncbi:MAG: DUF58 domain-containing protein [Polyangiaceae bacterium]|nr:DUF58 domain-containing protein [Polyangiaceae bacterium]
MSARARRVDWAKLGDELSRINRVLIPKTRAEKDRFDRSLAARIVRRLAVATERLSPEGQALAGVAALAGLAAIDVRSSEVYVAWVAIVALLGASLALSPLVALRGVRLEITGPRRVAVGEEARVTVTVRNDGPRAASSILVRGPWLPWDGVWTRRAAGVPLVEPGASARVELGVRLSSRGAHVISPVSARSIVPLGLAFGPRLLGAPLRLLVVPRVARVASLRWTERERLRRGDRPDARAASDARELTGVRPYRAGDPVRDLHARTWARVGEPVVREYREAPPARVALLLDTHAPRSPGELEAAVSLTAGVAARLLAGGASVEALLVGDAVHGGDPARRLETLDAVLDVLALADAGRAIDPDAALRALARSLPSLSGAVLVTTVWDAPRRQLRRRLAAAGILVVALAVGEGADPDVRFVSRGPLARGEALAL